MGSPLNGIFGWLKVLENNESTGFRDVEHPYRQFMRLRGDTASLGLTGGVLEFDAGDAVGPVGPIGPDGPLGATGANGAVAAIGLHDTTHSPVGLWQFQGSLAAAAGTAATVDAGTEAYSHMVPGLVGVKLDGTLRLKVIDAALRIPGDVTIEMLLILVGPTVAARRWLAYSNGTEEAESANAQYQLEWPDTLRRVTFFWEYSGGIDVEDGSGNRGYTPANNALPAKRLFHLAVTRIGNVVQLYVDGRAFGPPSIVMTAPTGGTAGTLWVGGTGSTGSQFSTPMLMASLKICASGLTPANVQAEYNRTAGKFYGRIL